MVTLTRLSGLSNWSWAMPSLVELGRNVITF
jgi:hypothetical protein